MLFHHPLPLLPLNTETIIPTQHVFQWTLSLYYCAIFIWTIYTSNPWYLQVIDYILIAFFIFDFGFYFLISGGSKIRFFISPRAIVDLITIIPTFVTSIAFFKLNFLESFRILRILRIEPLLPRLYFHFSGLYYCHYIAQRFTDSKSKTQRSQSFSFRLP